MKTALIFAAGRGERLRPLTDRMPKPMCLVKGMPLIEHHVRRLAAAGFTHVVINHAHLGGQIRQHLQQGAQFGIRITYSPEPPGALETAGAIIQALPFLGDAPFLTLSADLFTDYPFEHIELHPNYPAHLVLAPTSESIPKGDFGLNTQALVCNHPQRYTFGNIACFHPRLFQNLPRRRYPLGPLLRQWADAQWLTGEVYHGQWINIGSLAQLERANLL
ncbi:MAG: nucleotidyltransferase family protein [Gammaproteobacteria bacterium]|nr:nucleotidyltransferase family protein [Gammaproteobacteria bacterium]